MYHFERALLPRGWTSDVRLRVSEDGTIADIATGVRSTPTDTCYGTAIPGIPNVHSHAFQRALAGLTEYRASATDSFWTWRETMYRFANKITPEDLARIAAQLYVEMLKAGYTSVGEFHYIHHRPDGRPYGRPAEMSAAVLDAAAQAGIGITHLPVLYMRSGFDSETLQPEQRRFENSIKNYMELLDTLKTLCADDVTRNYGAALHSLRAVPPSAIAELVGSLSALTEQPPVHIHVSEQTLEVQQCLEWSGKRPVEWLLANHEIDEHWCLIHATHIDDSEISGLAQTGAVVGLCPTTEANLGDGIFPLRSFLDQGGRIAIGSDSNTSVNPVEELRWLEYAQRLKHESRNIAADADNPQTGRALVEQALAGGATALGQKVGRVQPGYRADILVLDDAAPALCCTPVDSMLDALIFSGNQPVIKDVMVAGVWLVRDFRHRNEAEIAAAFRVAVRSLRPGG